MAYPVTTFNTITEWENYLNTQWVTNGNEEITGVVGNNGVNGAVTFIKKSPLNWSKAAIYSGGGDIVLSDNFLGVVLFMTTTPDSISFGDNFYNQYVFLNMTGGNIQLDTPSVYYDLSGNPIDYLPANSVTVLYKATNDLWVLGNASTGGGGSTQRQPKFYIVGTTAGAPTAATSTWTNSAFEGAYIAQLLINKVPVDLEDAGDGSPYIDKPLSSNTLTIYNYGTGWYTGDKLQYILIVP